MVFPVFLVPEETENDTGDAEKPFFIMDYERFSEECFKKLNHGPKTLSELSKELGQPKTDVARAMEILEKKNLIKKSATGRWLTV